MLESWLSDETAETAGGVLRRAPVRP
jgi:hypothetical protein